MSSVLALDETLFHLINGVWTNRLFDAVFPALTDANKSRAVLVALALGAGLWILKARRKAVETLTGLALTVGASDLLAYRVLKQAVRRPRPEHSGIPVILRAGSHGLYGFPSNHAANCFAAAAFLGTLYPAALAPLLVVAALVGYSRVYVGAHFPLDVVGGGVFGAMIGRVSAAAFKRWRKARAPERRPGR